MQGVSGFQAALTLPFYCEATVTLPGTRHWAETLYSEALLAMVAQAQGTDDEAAAAAQASVKHWHINGHSRGMAMGLWAKRNAMTNRVLIKGGTVLSLDDDQGRVEKLISSLKERLFKQLNQP